MKVALITGSARRIGADIARFLHGAGMTVILHYHRSAQEAQALYHELNQQRPDSAYLLAADLSQADIAQQVIQQAYDFQGRLDVLVNNASCFYPTLIGEADGRAWDDLFTTNVKAPFFLSQAAAPFLKQQQGCIVNIADIHGEQPMRDYSIYCMTKSSLIMMTKALAKELAPAVRVNAVSPGPVVWPEGVNIMTEDEKKRLIEKTLLKRVGGAEAIAKAVLFLVRDADYVTGQIIKVDGGRSV